MVRAVYDAGSRATPASPSWGLAGAVDAPQVVQSVLVRIAYEYKPTRLTQGGTVATPAWDIAAQLMISMRVPTWLHNCPQAQGTQASGVTAQSVWFV